MPNSNYSVITNFGCHYQCPYCITKQTGMMLPETDTLEVTNTVLQLIDEDEIDFLSFSGGGDPMHGILDNGRPTQHAAWYSLLQAVCQDHDIKTEMHTSATTLYSYMLDRRIVSLLTKFDRPTTTRRGKFKTKYGRETPCCEVCGYSIGDMRWNHCPKCGAAIVDD